MIPINLNNENIELVDEFSQPSYTFGIVDGNRIAGMIDGLEAVAQAAAVILSVERYDYMIYSWDFGMEFQNLIGKDPSFCCPEIARRIKDALLQDERITDVDGWNFTKKANTITCSFVIHSVFGDKTMQKEVRI